MSRDKLPREQLTGPAPGGQTSSPVPLPHDDLVQDYLAESQEHLATIESDLLAIEQAGAQIDEQLVNRVFRAAHSIKGGAGFFGLTVIRELAHKTENVLDLIRSRQIAPYPETVSVLLLAFDKLRELVADYAASNQVDIGEFITALTAAASAQLPGAHKALLSTQVTLHVGNASRLIQISAFDLDQARRGGKWIYLIRYNMFHDFDDRGRTPLAALRALMKYGVILETAFDLASAGTLEQEASRQLTLEVLYATVLERDLIGELVVVEPQQILVIEQNGSVRPLSDEEPAPVPEAARGETRPEPLAGEAGNQLATLASATVAGGAPAGGEATGATLSSATLSSANLSSATAPAATLPTAAASPAGSAPEATVRLNVSLLDTLMTLVGELVLGRNELNEAVGTRNKRGLEMAARRLSMVTSELQEAVALTRMQPVGSVFAKFPRLVRELSRELSKDAQVQIEGGEVELDKTILEGLSDPLTHMVRNAVDHGLEPPAGRSAAGKPATGTVKLRARHQAGQVVIEIGDDGRGLSADKVAASCVKKGLLTQEQAQAMSEAEKMALIFLPGVSTAEKVSDVSGRGVGMDVVKTNLDKLGGKIEIDSALGRGTSFRIKLPLTLAIMPSLLVSQGNERFAIPQSSVSELIRVPAAERAGRLDHVGGGEVLLLRDRLVPLLHLADALGLPAAASAPGAPANAGSALNIVLVETGAFEYGLVVEELHDTVEIVVKPLGRHLQGLRDYAGATILGDGRVAPILDVEGLAARAGLAPISGAFAGDALAANRAVTVVAETSSFLLFYNAPGESCALPIELVTRIESVTAAQVENLGGRRTFQYRGVSLPLVALEDLASVGQLQESQDWKVIVVERRGEARPEHPDTRSNARSDAGQSAPETAVGSGSFGVLVAGPMDMIETALDLDPVTLRQRGVAGSAILNGKATLILEIADLAASALGRASGLAQGAGSLRMALTDANGQGTETAEMQRGAASGSVGPTILLAEDSGFFRGQITRLMETVGYRVLPAEDGQAAWELLDRFDGTVSAVVTDIEMPRLGGIGLARKIRGDRRFGSLPIIAVSTLAGEEEIAEGLAAGVSEYQVKLDQDQLLSSLRKALGPASATR